MMTPVVNPRHPENPNPYGPALPQPRRQTIPEPQRPWSREEPLSDVLALWQTKLRVEDRDYRQRYDAAIPRSFWEKLRSCRLVTDLCAHHSGEPSESLHAALGLLESFHRREAGFGAEPARASSGAATRKKVRRHWEAQVRSAKRAVASVGALDAWSLPAPAREACLTALRDALRKAREFAKNPPSPEVKLEIDPTTGAHRVVTDMTRPVVTPVPEKGRSRRRHLGSVQALVDLEIALLDEFLPPSNDRKRWARLLSLLQHFNPKVFALIGVTPDRLRKRVQWFRREHAEIFEQHRRRALSGARWFVAHHSE